MIIWHKLAAFLVIGYLSMGRSFAYLGIPPLRIFIGEIALAAFLLLKPRIAVGTWTSSLLRLSPFSLLGLSLLAFISYGVWQVARGVLGGSSLFFTLKYFVFNYYPIYLFFGTWVGYQAWVFVPQMMRLLAWVNGVYGLLFVVGLKNVAMVIPGSNIAIFGQPGGGAIAILGLLCFERNLAAVWPLLALNTVVTLAMQVRAEWLGLGVGALAWGLLTGRLGRVAAIGMAGIAVLGLIELADLKIAGRGSPISPMSILGRVIAPIDKELAKEFTPHADDDAGTVEWRQKWWDEIWASAQSTSELGMLGHGYGFDLFSLAPAGVRVGQAVEIRTPHNVFFYALGYTGWIGVALFVVLQVAILRLLWRSYRRGGEPIGLIWWAAGLSMAFFSNYFETPFGAIPFYLLVGMGIAPGLRPEGALDARSARAQLLQAAGR
jgi:hypothetical protein